mgnify:CR=1 FL=1
MAKTIPTTLALLMLAATGAQADTLLIDGIDVDSWRELNESIDKPLLNRALRGTYPPGSTFKPFMAMAALNTGKRNPHQIIFDGGTFQFGNHTFRSHGDHGLGAAAATGIIVTVLSARTLSRAWIASMRFSPLCVLIVIVPGKAAGRSTVRPVRFA